MAKGKRSSTEINASSMADIAFLLLIFFLVTTTIDQDKGILNKLPPWIEDQEEIIIKTKQRDVLEILINANNQLLVESEYMKIEELRQRTIDHILNKGKRDDYPATPQDAIISLKNDRGTSYDIYIQVQNELKGAYTSLRNEKTLQVSKGEFKTYVELKQCTDPLEKNKLIKKCRVWKKEVKEAYPMKISEAEPKNFGGGNE